MSASLERIEALTVELFADGADLEDFRRLAEMPYIRGFTTNPTLMRRAGVVDYEAFAREAAEIAGSRPISFEVFADDFGEMIAQARTISGWAPNAFVKIPVTDTRGRSSTGVVSTLASEGVRLNVTALTTPAQVETVVGALQPEVASFVSLFAGRIADTGVDPVPLVREAIAMLGAAPAARLIWASPREVLNIFQADVAGCHVITVTSDVLAKLKLVGKDLTEFSLDTVRMFHDDAAAAGYAIETVESRAAVGGGGSG